MIASCQSMSEAEIVAVRAQVPSDDGEDLYPIGGLAIGVQEGAVPVCDEFADHRGRARGSRDAERTSDSSASLRPRTR